ncbi:hypothetical protein MTR_5g044920 [Medicago truncatula]|uniref:Uncharacterized protein n=1 Tax=Medicago truncatula TaxID=3880 RepID=G7JY13_MEDTR|nr:hypothetical protein MTR_5g044920 [Medicago truncatula]
MAWKQLIFVKKSELHRSVANTLKTRFQPKEDELLIQSWLNISKDPIVGNDQRGDSFGRGLVKLITTIATRIFKRENRRHLKVDGTKKSIHLFQSLLL